MTNQQLKSNTFLSLHPLFKLLFNLVFGLVFCCSMLLVGVGVVVVVVAFIVPNNYIVRMNECIEETCTYMHAHSQSLSHSSRDAFSAVI